MDKIISRYYSILKRYKSQGSTAEKETKKYFKFLQRTLKFCIISLYGELSYGKT